MGLQIFKHPITQRKYFVRVYRSTLLGYKERKEYEFTNYDDAIEKAQELEKELWLKENDEVIIIEVTKVMKQLERKQ